MLHAARCSSSSAPLGVERNPERVVLGSVPAHGRLHDQPSPRQEIERGQVLRQQQRMPERRDDRAGHQPEPGGHGRDGREQHERTRPGRHRVLVAGQRVIPRVRGKAVGVRARSEHHVLADHHRVEPGMFRLDRETHQRRKIARRRHRPVLAEDQDELRRRHRRSRSARRVFVGRNRGPWPGTISDATLSTRSRFA